MNVNPPAPGAPAGMMWPMIEDKVVRVYASGDQMAGELMRGRLEAEGIPVMVKGEGEGVYAAGPVYLWVTAEHETAARAVVAAAESGEYAIDELPDDEPVDADEQT